MPKLGYDVHLRQDGHQKNVIGRHHVRDALALRDVQFMLAEL